MNLAPLLDRASPVLLDTTLGTRDPARIERALGRLPLGSPVDACFWFSISVGAVFGVRLADARRVAVKVHQPRTGVEELAAIQRAQGHFAANGVPCPAPVIEPTPFLGTLATAETWIEEGDVVADVTPARRRVLAALLARLIELGDGLLPLPALEYYRFHQPDPWPRPHNALFDFAASRAGAEAIDAVGHRAAPLMRAGRIVLGHQDWSVKHFRFRGDEITAVYDWDSLSVDCESIAVGGAAATHTAEFSRPWVPRVEDALAFVGEYERARGRAFTGGERRAVHARIAYLIAYTARCEHALDGRSEATSVTAVLPEFAHTFLP